MLSQRMIDALNEQFKNEMYSSYLYLSMSAYFSRLNLNGFANWMRIQAKEEDAHAMKLYQYVLEQRGRMEVRAIAQPPADYASPLVVFQHTRDHEKNVTAMINGLVAMAREENDNATESFLKWYVDEQVEEESNVDQVLQQLEIVGNDGTSLFMLDKEMAARVFTPVVGVMGRMA